MEFKLFITLRKFEWMWRKPLIFFVSFWFQSQGFIECFGFFSGGEKGIDWFTFNNMIIIYIWRNYHLGFFSLTFNNNFFLETNVWVIVDRVKICLLMWWWWKHSFLLYKEIYWIFLLLLLLEQLWNSIREIVGSFFMSLSISLHWTQKKKIISTFIIVQQRAIKIIIRIDRIMHTHTHIWII